MLLLKKTMTSRNSCIKKSFGMEGRSNFNFLGKQFGGLVILLVVMVSTNRGQNIQGFLDTPETTSEPSGVSNSSCAGPREGRDSQFSDLQRATQEFLSTPKDGGKNGTLDFCSSVVSYVNNRAMYMLHQAKFLTDVALDDNNTFQLLKGEFEIELNQLTSLVENLNKNHEEEVSVITKELKKHLTEFRKNITDSLDQMETLLVRKEESTCVSEIRNGKYHSALAIYRKLGDDSKFAKMVTDAYSGDIEKLPNVLKFITIAGSCEHQALAYQTLFDTIERENQLGHPNIFFFSNLIEDCASASLKDDIKRSETKAVNAFMFEYKLENVFQVLEFEKRVPVEEVSVRFGIHSRLFHELESRNHSNCKELVALAYRVKLLHQFCRASPQDCQYIEQKLWDLEQKFPKSLTKLLFDESTVIENKGQPPYFLHVSNNGTVHIKPWKDFFQGSWRAIPLEDSYYLELENDYRGTRLFVQDSVLFAGNRTGKTAHWEVLPEADGYYRLRNRQHGVLGLACTDARGHHCVLRCFSVDVSNVPQIMFYSLWKFN